MAITQAMCTSFKKELMEAKHNFLASGGHEFRIALYTSSASLGAATPAYTTSGEISGQGYSAKGQALTNISPTSSGTTAFTSFAEETFPSASFTANGALIFNEDTSGDPAVAVLAFGGYVHPGYSLSVELWNGSTWSEQTELSEGHYAAGSGGTSTSAITAGGQDAGPASANTETWNGSSWSEEADLNTGRVEMAGTGPNSEALLVFGGNPGPGLFTKTENFDGTTWAEVADLSTARQNMSSHVGTTSAALAAGGHDASDRTASTEEFSAPTAAQSISGS